jgi:hypothetical protein
MFIEHFAIVASRLRKLTPKNAEWAWTEACKVAFIELKRIVGLDITLKDLDYSKEGIWLAVDSSKFGAGGVLSQEEDLREGSNGVVQVRYLHQSGVALLST